MIYKKAEFVQDDTGDRDFPIKQVDQLEPLDGSGARFIGRAILHMQTPMGIQQIPVSFEIPAVSIEEAFQKYSECARPKIEELKDHIERRLEQIRQQQSRIVTPDQSRGPTGGIVSLDDWRRNK